MQVCVWHHDGGEIDGLEYDPGWYWDDSEDHGGYDRISPMGPYEDVTTVLGDASSVFEDTDVVFTMNMPDHYPRKSA